MHTLVTSSYQEAAALLRSGHLVAFPTETVYGLGADAWNAEAVRDIFEAKGRPGDNPLIVHLADADRIRDVALDPPPYACLLMDHFLPGPTTFVLPRRPSLPDVVTGGLDTVGVRVPLHALAHAFLAACDRPVAAPSANRSGRPSPTTWQAVSEDLNGRIACILKGPPSERGLESTVVDCTGAAPVILRTGFVTLEALTAVVPETRLATGTHDHLERSPGTRYRHYAPRARVLLVDDSTDAVPETRAGYIGLAPPGGPMSAWGRVAVPGSVEAYAQQLFAFFRQCDAEGLTTIFAQTVPPVGLGRAVMDRLQRAAAGSRPTPEADDTSDLKT